LGILLSSRKELPDSELRQAEVLEELGMQFWFLANAEKTLQHWREAATLFERAGDRNRAGGLWSKIGLIYHMGAYDKDNALASYQKARELLDEKTAASELADVILNMCVVNLWDGDIAELFKNHEYAMSLAKRSSNDRVEAMCNQLLAISMPFSKELRHHK
jgi:tetratricopeptide (TPR) repeat protein